MDGMGPGTAALFYLFIFPLWDRLSAGAVLQVVEMGSERSAGRTFNYF